MLDVSGVPLQVPAARPLSPLKKQLGLCGLWSALYISSPAVSCFSLSLILSLPVLWLFWCPTRHRISCVGLKCRRIHTLGPFLTRGRWELTDVSFLYHPWTFWDTFHMDPYKVLQGQALLPRSWPTQSRILNLAFLPSLLLCSCPLRPHLLVNYLHGSLWLRLCF